MGAVTLGVVVVVGVGGLGFVWSEWVGAFFFELSSLRGVKEAGVEVGGVGVVVWAVDAYWVFWSLACSAV